MNSWNARESASRPPVERPAAGSSAASGSAAYQYMSGRLWSSASSPWPTRPASDLPSIRPAAAAGGPTPGRAGPLARDRSAASSANFARIVQSARPLLGRQLDRPGADRRVWICERARDRSRDPLRPTDGMLAPAECEAGPRARSRVFCASSLKHPAAAAAAARALRGFGAHAGRAIRWRASAAATSASARLLGEIDCRPAWSSP